MYNYTYNPYIYIYDLYMYILNIGMLNSNNITLDFQGNIVGYYNVTTSI